MEKCCGARLGKVYTEHRTNSIQSRKIDTCIMHIYIDDIIKGKREMGERVVRLENVVDVLSSSALDSCLRARALSKNLSAIVINYIFKYFLL